MSDTIKKILAPLASLRFTVVLLALSMVLIFAGTTIQTEMGIWDVQRIYFHSWFTMLQLRLFFPLWDWGMKHFPGAIPFPGGYSIILLLLINLLAAHSVRFKLSWKRSGILLIHAGLILLISGEVVTAEGAHEGRMTIDNGSSSNFTEDIRQVELAVTDPAPQNHDREIIFPVGMLSRDRKLEHPDLPFTLTIERYYPNTDLAGPMQTLSGAESLADVGTGVGLKIMQADRSAGTESALDMPSAFVKLTDKDGRLMGTYLLSTVDLNPGFTPINLPQIVEVGGKEYWLQLRFRRLYKPYTLHLIKFSHDLYQGTDVPKNFSSLVRIDDPANNVDREVLIWMNHPLRYAGETFYQADYDHVADQFTILQVVKNPGWLIPYISCSMVGLGMLVHFGMHLLKFLGRINAPVRAGTAPVDPGRRPGSFEPPLIATKSNGKHKGGVAVEDRVAVLPSISTRSAMASATRVPAVVITALCALYLLSSLAPPSFKTSFDLDSFARLPISHEGRTMPLDSLARNSLRIMSGRSELVVGNESRPAISWLLDVLAQPDRAAAYNIFRIDHPDLRSLLNLPETEPGGGYRARFSFDDMYPRFKALEEQYVRAIRIQQKERDLFQRKVIELVQQVMLFNSLAAKDTLLISPPLEGTQWRSFEEASQATAGAPDPGAAAFKAITSAKAQGMSKEFGEAAAAYWNLLETRAPEMTRKLSIEVLFNRAAPFITCMALYVIVFILAALSWLKWHGPLAKAALWVLILTAIFHTLGLIARVYIQGRPPITNLYSTAIFIAWAAVVSCILMELIYRNGVACAAASAIAFPSLLIAHYLAGSGDTMQMLQAVLDTNIWLATHVVIINIGYAATFLAGFLAAGYVLAGLLTTALTEDARRTMYRMVYGVVCFAMLFSFVGTILGGIWADQSWGRFWGWDPKENGAVLIVFWNAICLHARWGGVVKERGFMLLAVFGNIVTAWSWFGTNMLGVGLHSYGFMDSALFWLLSFAAVQLGIIGAGLLPVDKWRSMEAQRGFQPRTV